MKTITFFKALTLLLGLMMANEIYGQYLVNFEGTGETKTAYASGTVTLTGIQWNMTEVLIGTDAADWKNGARSARLRGYGTSSMTMLANKSNGIGSISFFYRRYGTDSQVDWKVEYSSDDGLTWTQIGIPFTAPASDVVQTFSETLNITGSIRIRIKRATESGTSNRRLNIDDILITDYYGGTPIVAAPTFNPPGGSYYAPQSVVISTSTEESDVYYSFTGDDGPWTYFTDPIGVETNTAIWAYASKIGWDNSPVVQAVYSFPPVIEVADIASLRAYASAKTSDVFKLTGEAVLTFKTSSRNAKYIQDATGAILIDDLNGKITTTYNLYDGITGITGTLGFYFNMLQFTPVADPGAATSSNNVIVPEELTLAELTTGFQARLVKVAGVSISGTGNFISGTNYTISDNSKATGILRTAYSDLNYIGQPIPTVPQDITAVVLQYQTTMQLVPRGLDDFSNTILAVDPPVSFTANTFSSNQIDLLFTPNAAENTVAIVFNKTGIFNEPSGELPAVGQEFAGGTLIYTGITSPFSHTGLNPEDTCFYKAWSYDGASYSPGLAANATTFASEPTNHASDLSATANSHNSITIAWTDSDAAAYLIKGSDVGFGDIIPPVDGTPETDGGLVKNVSAAKGSHEFTGLTPETEYFFKIFPYNGTGISINYKTDGDVPQASAETGVAPPTPMVITKWDFDDSNLNPNIGTGTASNTGGTSTAYASGNPGQAWNTSTYPTQSTSSGTAGVQFMVSTVGFEDILLNFDHRSSGTASRWAQVDYTTDGGASWTALDTNDGELSPHDTFYPFEFDFSGVPAANNNSNFGVRIVSIFSPLAFNQNASLSYGPNEAYMRANEDAKYPPDSGVGTGNYSGAGTWRFDNVTLSGFTYTPVLPVKLVITDVNGGAAPTVDIPFSVTIQTQSADNVPSNVDTDTQVMLILGTGTGSLGGIINGTIPAGQNTLVLNEVTYDTPEDGVIIAAMTISGMNLFPGASAPFNVISPATHLVFVGFPQSGYINQPVSVFTVEARRPNNTVDPGFTGTISLSLAGKAIPVGGTVSGTLSVAAIAGVATFNNVFFDDAGTYSLNADAEGLTQAISSVVQIMPEPSISGILLPAYINADSPSNNRLPYAFRAKIDNLLPNTTYKYINQAVISTDGATSGGAGNCIFVVQDGNFYRSTSPSFNSSANHGEFITDENGSYTGWFILEATGNARFTPGNEVFMRIRINDGAGGTTAMNYLTISDAVKVIGFGTEANTNLGTALMGLSEFFPKNFVFLYDENLEFKGRPIAGTSVESVGINYAGISQYAAFYKSSVSGIDGAWGTIIPNVNAIGVRRIEERSLADGGVMGYVQSFDGMWGETNTVNPDGGTTPLVIDLTAPVTPVFLALDNITITPLMDTCFSAYDTIQTSNFVVQDGGIARLVTSGVIMMLEGTVVESGGYLRAWIDPDSVYCFLPAAMMAEKVNHETVEYSILQPEISTSLFAIYPNPGNGNFTLRIEQAIGEENIILEIFSMMGERLIQRELSGTTRYHLDLTAMPRGMYLIRIIYRTQSEMQRIIKQ